MEFHGAYDAEVEKLKVYLEKHPERASEMAIALYEISLLQYGGVELLTKSYQTNNKDLLTGNFDEFLKLQQPKENPGLISQKYALLYLQYDPCNRDRDWKSLLESNSVEKIDFIVAQRALAAGEVEETVNEMIYYGSPSAQQMEHPARRIYAATLVAKAIECHSAN